MRGEFFTALVITSAIYSGVHAQSRVALETFELDFIGRHSTPGIPTGRGNPLTEARGPKLGDGRTTYLLLKWFSLLFSFQTYLLDQCYLLWQRWQTREKYVGE